MKFKRILCLFLAVLTLCGGYSFTLATTSAAAPADTGSTGSSDSYIAATDAALEREFESNQFLIASGDMKLTTRRYGYELYCNEYTGEIAYRNMATGQVISTNPCNLENIGKTTKAKLLSQLEIKFTDSANNTISMYSFTDAAQRGQIIVKNIKDGLRVEYTMGRIETTYLIPIYIEKSRFETLILKPMRDYLETLDGDAYTNVEFYLGKLEASYTLYDPNDKMQNAATIASMKEKYEVTRDGMAIYVLSASTDKEKRILEGYIKSYCPDYTDTELEFDNNQTKAPKDVSESPVFRLSIEYVLKEDGLSICLPANGIRFDETRYTLTYIRMLQHLGAGNLAYGNGYVFYPDGSGSIIEFSDFYSTSVSGKKEQVILSGKVYGDDYSYYNISNAKHQETIRMPVFGVISAEDKDNKASSGFLAILEEGASLAEISASFGATSYYYGSAYTTFYPRPTDTYNMADAISVGDNKDWTVVSDKKYTGNYVLKVVMLTDPTIGDSLIAGGEVEDYYTTSYIGMAKAYQDYLVRNGILTPLTDTKEQLPLYIQTFGSFKTVEKILSIPITVDAPLTSFADVSAMYDELSEAGITNIHFQLTGFANGGMDSTYPSKVKWVKALGGQNGFQDLLDDANARKFGVYPDFDFMYISETSAFDGVSLRQDASRAVDDRYCSKQFYDALFQEFVSYFDLVVTPSSVQKFTSDFSEKYTGENLIGISVSTMGSDLNSDFNEDNLYNRDDAQQLVDSSLATLKRDFGSVMSNGGNIYTLKYVDHLLEAAVDSSNFKYNSHTVPFVGMVLHGYLNYAGSAINESGDGDYQLLKAIESGASLLYTLSYEDDNIIKLKNDKVLSKNYSIRYSIWRESLIRQYNTLNTAIGDLQEYNIVDHAFLIGERIPTASEDNGDLEALRAAVTAALDTAYVRAQNDVYRNLGIRQATVALIKQGITDLDYLIYRVQDRLYNVVLTEAEKALITEIFNNNDIDDPYFDKKVSIVVDRDAVLASMEASLGYAPTADLIAIVDAYIAERSDATGDEVGTVTSVKLEYTLPTTDSFATDGEGYVHTKYTDSNGGIIMVTYAKGDDVVRFILNYNSFAVQVRLPGEAEARVIESYAFVRL